MADILVMCHGNYMRSPACEAVLKAEGLDVESAGFHPRASKAAKKMREAMEARGYDLSEHKPRLVTEEMLEGKVLILLMDAGNARRWNELFPPSQYPVVATRTHCLGHYIGLKRIQDPAFQQEPRFGAIVDEIIAASKVVAGRWRNAKGIIEAIKQGTGTAKDLTP